METDFVWEETDFVRERRGSVADNWLLLMQNDMQNRCPKYDLYKHQTQREKHISFLPIGYYELEFITLFSFGTRVVYIGKWQNNCMHRFKFSEFTFLTSNQERTNVL